ncbi:MAG: rhamnulokinase [Firmicutes bacterium]|nr:rhamnulokinase [Bacillota bacterium]
MTAELNLAAADLGAESGRVIHGHFQSDHLTINEIHRFRNQSVLLNKYLYWDFLNLFYNITQGLRKMSLTNDDLHGVAVDTWGVDYGLLDSLGHLLANPVSYRDHRTDNILPAVFDRVNEQEFYRRTGIQVMPINTSCQLTALLNEHSVQLAAAEDLLFMPGLFSYFLSGVKANDATIASTSQLYDPKGGMWALDLVENLGLPARLFKPVVRPGTVLGELTAFVDGLFAAAKVVAVGGHDTASAVAAVPTQQEDFIYISCGTWSLVGTELRGPILSEEARTLNFSNEVGVEDTIRFLKNVMGLWLLQECRRSWERAGKSYDYSELMTEGMKAEAWRTLLNPDDQLFLNPVDMPSAIAEYAKRTEQPVPETVGEYVRCILDSLALKYWWVIERIQELTGVDYDFIHIVGGGTQNEFLMQLTADVTGQAVVAGPIEATAIGNILMQVQALGSISDLAHLRQVVRNSFDVKKYQPGDLPQEIKEIKRRFVELNR